MSGNKSSVSKISVTSHGAAGHQLLMEALIYCHIGFRKDHLHCGVLIIYLQQMRIKPTISKMILKTDGFQCCFVKL